MKSQYTILLLFFLLISSCNKKCHSEESLDIDTINFPKSLAHLVEHDSNYLLCYINGDCYTCNQEISRLINYFRKGNSREIDRKIIIFYTNDSIYFSSAILPGLNMNNSEFNLAIDSKKSFGELNNLNTNGYNYFFIVNKKGQIFKANQFNTVMELFNNANINLERKGIVKDF